MTDTEKLISCVMRTGHTQVWFLDKIGMSRQTFYNKSRNITEFKASEIDKISQVLELDPSQRASIFFNIN